MKELIIGERYREKLEIPLISNGFSPFWLPENPDVDKRLASHTDLSIFIYKKMAILARYLRTNAELVNFFTSRGFKTIISSFAQGSKYPNDINLCAGKLEDGIIHNIKYTDPEIASLNLNFLNVNQGYVRCTALIINNSIITSDKGIADTARTAGIKYLLIDEDGIDLEGFNRGFLGGASFIAENTVYFTGNLDKHPSATDIKEFFENEGYKISYLTEGPLFDIGGAIYID